MTTVFISYRPPDSADVAGRLYERLADRLGVDKVFKNVNSNSAGDFFLDSIAEAITESDAVLALVGDRWLSEVDEDGRRRLDQPHDYVRRELELAFAQDKRVIPVLLGTTLMPSADDLPESLNQLAYLNAIRVRPDPDFPHDIDRLLRHLGGPDRKPPVPMAPVHQHTALPLHFLIVIVFGGLALAAVLGGIYAIKEGGGNAATLFKLLGAEFSTTHVGVAFVCIGLMTAFLTVRAVLKNQHELAALPDNHGGYPLPFDHSYRFLIRAILIISTLLIAGLFVWAYVETNQHPDAVIPPASDGLPRSGTSGPVPDGYLTVFVASVHSGEVKQFAVAPKASLRWLNECLRDLMNLKTDLDTGGPFPFRIRWILVDERARKNFESMDRSEQVTIHAVISDGDAVKISKDRNMSVEEAGGYDRMRCFMYAIEDTRLVVDPRVIPEKTIAALADELRKSLERIAHEHDSLLVVDNLNPETKRRKLIKLRAKYIADHFKYRWLLIVSCDDRMIDMYPSHYFFADRIRQLRNDPLGVNTRHKDTTEFYAALSQRYDASADDATEFGFDDLYVRFQRIETEATGETSHLPNR